MPSSRTGLQPTPVERLNARGAEYLACEWMRWLGIGDALVTPAQRDGGVDVRSREFLAQVKHLVNEPTGVAAIRQLHGVAAAEGRRALFFTSSSYTRDAIAFARSAHMALFVVRAAEGRLVPHGVAAQQLWLHGAPTIAPVNDHQPAPVDRVAR